MSGNSNAPELERKRRRKLENFRKRMNKYGLKVRPAAPVFSTSYPNTVMVIMETEEYPVRGHGAQIKQLRAEGYAVIKQQRIERTKPGAKTSTVQRSYFRVQSLTTIKVQEESGVGL